MDVPRRQQRSNDHRRRSSTDKNLSRSAPSTGGLMQLFLQCTSSIRDSFNHLTPSRERDYTRLFPPIENMCDMCSAIRIKTKHLKCMHSSCSKCLEKYKVLKMGCMICNYKNQSPNYKLQSSYVDKCRSDAKREEQEVAAAAAPDMSGHVFEDDQLDKEGREARIQILMQDLENFSLPRIRIHRQVVRDQMDQLKKDSETLPGTIREHVEELKTLMDQRVPEMISSLQESNERHQWQLIRHELFVTNMMDTVRTTIDKCKDVMDNISTRDEMELQRLENDAKNIIELTQQVADERVHMHYWAHGEMYRQTMDHDDDDIAEENRRKQENMERDVEVICGSVAVRVFIKPKMVVSLVTRLHVKSFVKNVCPINSKQAWVSFGQHVQLCSKSGQTGKPIDVGDEIVDTALCADGSVVLACDHSVKVISFGELKTLFAVNEPTGVAELPDGNLLLLEETGIVIRDKMGTLIRGLNCNVKMKLPLKLSVNASGDMLVCDWHSSEQHVLVLDSGGKHKATITHEGLNPKCASFTHQGFVLVSDFLQDRLDIYTQQGQHLQTIVNTVDPRSKTEPRGIQSAVSDPSGDIWVGDWFGNVFVYSMKCTSSARSSPSRALREHGVGSLVTTV